MIHVAVVEDEEKYREQLSEFLSRYGKEKEISIQTRMYCDGIDILDEYAGQFEVILLDIRMKHIDGMEAARKMGKRQRGYYYFHYEYGRVCHTRLRCGSQRVYFEASAL